MGRSKACESGTAPLRQRREHGRLQQQGNKSEGKFCAVSATLDALRSQRESEGREVVTVGSPRCSTGARGRSGLEPSRR